MKANEVKLLDFLRKSSQFTIPIYQRTYSWGQPECQELWDDIIRAGSNDRISTHFVGSIVYIEEGLFQVSMQPPLLVIDGQQRLTTVSLILEALARKILEGAEPVDGFSAKKLRNYYLLNPEEEGERGYKLLLSQTDKKTFLSLMGQESLPRESEQSIRISGNFDFFEKKIEGLEGSLEPLCRGLAKLIVVDIALSRDQDSPQLIFESMNSTGLELSQADLIRNFILMGLEPQAQTSLYKKYWRSMEVDFGQKSYAEHFDDFMHRYMTMRIGRAPNVKDVYKVFKVYSHKSAERGVDDLLSDIHVSAGHYCAMALGKEQDSLLAPAFADLKELKVDVAYPLLLELYQDYEDKVLSRDELCQVVRWIESYVFRRVICEIPSNTLKDVFARFSKALDKKACYFESLQTQFRLLPLFPGNTEFLGALKKYELYKPNKSKKRAKYLLRRLENHGRKEPVLVDEYTIEHIMPQSKKLSAKWRKDLGKNWDRVHSTWLHTIGNLTLTGYNSEYGNRSFDEKRDMEGGFRDSPLFLNRGLDKVKVWNEVAIGNRANRLIQRAIKVWEIP